jgi:hypothetical protein
VTIIVSTLSIDFTVKVKGHSTQCFYEHLSKKSLIQLTRLSLILKFRLSRQVELSSLLRLCTMKIIIKMSLSTKDSWMTAK